MEVFRPKIEEVTGNWRKLYNEKSHGLYFSLNVILMIKSWSCMMGGACDSWLGSREMHTGFGWGNPSENDHLEDLIIDRG
jgi:hypothetical protein